MSNNSLQHNSTTPSFLKSPENSVVINTSYRATLPLTAETVAMQQAGNTGTSLHDQHLSQCIQLKQNYLNNSNTNIYQNVASNFSTASRISIDDPLCRKMGEDILYVDHENEVLGSQIRNTHCECGLCPKPEHRDNNTLSDLQRSVVPKCSCDSCNSNGDILSYYRNCSNQNSDSGIVICESCKKQKISLSNFKALQIANSLRIADDKMSNGAASDEELFRKIDISLNMEDTEHRKKHNRHNSDSATAGECRPHSEPTVKYLNNVPYYLQVQILCNCSDFVSKHVYSHYGVDAVEEL